MPTQQPVTVSFNKPYADYLGGGLLPFSPVQPVTPYTQTINPQLQQKRIAISNSTQQAQALSPQIFGPSIFEERGQELLNPPKPQIELKTPNIVTPQYILPLTIPYPQVQQIKERV
jgi:hypothetical protein